MLGGSLVRLALLAAMLLLVASPLRGAVSHDPRPAPRSLAAPAGLPPQLAEVVAAAGELQRGSLAGRLRRDAPIGAAGSARGGTRPFADSGPRRQIDRLRRDLHRALRAASTAEERVRVIAWHGVYVSGRRAVALADVGRSVRSRPGVPFRRLPLVRARLRLARDGGRWRVVDGTGAMPYK